MLIDRLSVICAGTMLDCVLSAYLVLTKIAVHRVNLERGHVLLERAEQLANTRGWGRLSAAAVLERARLHLDEGRVSEGTACLDRLKHFAAEYPVSAPCAWSEIHRYAALARAYLASTEGRFDDAISILMNTQREAEAAGSYYFALRVATLQSILLFKADKAAEALHSFGSVLHLAASAGIYRTILDEGIEAGPLLRAFRESVERTGRWRDLMPFIDKLIEGWRSRYGSESLQMPRSSLAETLSNREGDILKFIAQGLSNKEIAKTLAIAPETVKSHVKQIFVKLGVEKRAQAVSRAQSFGLVRTF